MSEEVLQRVVRVIAETQKIPIGKVNPDSSFEELQIDSLDAISIVFAVENEFNINVPDDAAKSIRTVRDMASGIEQLLAPGA